MFKCFLKKKKKKTSFKSITKVQDNYFAKKLKVKNKSKTFQIPLLKFKFATITPIKTQ